MKLLLILILTFTQLLADRDGGPYLGIGYGFGDYSDDKLYKEVKENTSESLTIYGGAYINKHLSVELAYVDFDAKGYGDGFLVVDETDQEKFISFSVMSISTLAHYAFFDDALDFYVRFGAGEVSSSASSDEGFTMLYGAGVAYRFNKYIALKVAYDLYKIGLDTDADNSSEYKMTIEHIYSAIEVQF